jgi:hypothetical protein
MRSRNRVHDPRHCLSGDLYLPCRDMGYFKRWTIPAAPLAAKKYLSRDYILDAGLPQNFCWMLRFLCAIRLIQLTFVLVGY